MPLRASVHRISDISTPADYPKKNNFYKKPAPSSALLSSIGIVGPSLLFAPLALRAFDRLTGVQVLGLDGDDVEVVTQFAGLGAEAEICYRGDCDRAVLEAQRPQLFGFVLQFQLE